MSNGKWFYNICVNNHMDMYACVWKTSIEMRENRKSWQARLDESNSFIVSFFASFFVVCFKCFIFCIVDSFFLLKIRFASRFELSIRKVCVCVCTRVIQSDKSRENCGSSIRQLAAMSLS